MLINVAIRNFENNGGGDRDLWQRMHDRLASLDVHLLLQQEMWGAQDDGNVLADAAEAVLGMAGFIGRECCTAVHHDPKLFTPAAEYPKTGPVWALPPAVRSFRLAGTDPDATPLIVGSYHLNYCSTTIRLAKAEWLTKWNDKWVKNKHSVHRSCIGPDSVRRMIDMKGLSDRHTVVMRLERDTLTGVLNHPLTQAA